MNIYGTCIATTSEEAEALKQFMYGQMGMAAPKADIAPKPDRFVVYATVDCDNCITALYWDEEEARNDCCTEERICEYVIEEGCPVYI